MTIGKDKYTRNSPLADFDHLYHIWLRSNWHAYYLSWNPWNVQQSIIRHDQHFKFFSKRHIELYHLQIACYNMQWSIPYNISYHIYDTIRWSSPSNVSIWSNIINEFFISPLTCIYLTRSTLLPERYTNILKTNNLSLGYLGNLLSQTYLKPKWVFECYNTIHLSILNKMSGAWYEVTTPWIGKSNEFIHDDLQGRTYQMIAFNIKWRFAKVVYKEIFFRCHYYNKILDNGCFHDLIGNTLVRHVKWPTKYAIWHRVFMNTKMYINPQILGDVE